MRATTKRNKRPKRFVTGTCCWFIDSAGRWYLCRISTPKRGSITLHSDTGSDYERLTPWPFPDGLEIKKTSSLIKRLRPLSAHAL